MSSRGWYGPTWPPVLTAGTPYTTGTGYIYTEYRLQSKGYKPILQYSLATVKQFNLYNPG